MTPQFAPVGPLPLLRDLLIRSPSTLGGYHLLLAHDVLNNQTEWAEWSKAMKIANGGHHHVIMDSSVIELGAPVDIEHIVAAAEVVGARTIVLPDIIGDFEATMALIDDAMRNEHVNKFRTMLVPQGMTLEQYIQSLEAFRQFNFDYIGLPRDATRWMPSRAPLAHLCWIMHPTKEIHLLGMSNESIADDFITAITCRNIMGIDSAVPVRAGQKNIRFSLARTDYGPRGEYWDSRAATTQAIDNICYVRELLKGRR